LRRSRSCCAATRETRHGSRAQTGRQLVVIHGRHCVPGGLCVVNRAVFSPDGARIATTGWDVTVRIFDAATGRQLRVLRGHGPGGLGTYPVAWSPDGSRLLSTAADGTRIWDARTGKRLLALPPSGGPGFSAAWSPNGRQILTESGIGPAVWDASSGERLRTLETSAASSDMVFSRDGSRLATTTVDERAFAIRIWDWPAGVETLMLHDSGLRVVELDARSAPTTHTFLEATTDQPKTARNAVTGRGFQAD
jgi:WD40 repeat protein